MTVPAENGVEPLRLSFEARLAFKELYFITGAFITGGGPLPARRGKGAALRNPHRGRVSGCVTAVTPVIIDDTATRAV